MATAKTFAIFHIVANQHLRVLKIEKNDTFESLVTAILEAKMDQTTMREWQSTVEATRRKTILAATTVCGFSGT